MVLTADISWRAISNRARFVVKFFLATSKSKFNKEQGELLIINFENALLYGVTTVLVFIEYL